MRLTKVHVKGFKSLIDFDLELSPFTCLIGLNGCGKSTVLQFFDFISHVLAGDVEKWYEAREWEPGEELSGSGAIDIDFRLEFEDGAFWEGAYDPLKRVCREEEIRTNTSFIKVDDSGGTFQGLKLKGIGGTRAGEVDWSFVPEEFVYSGSITSVFRDETLSPEIQELMKFVRGVRSFDTLTPQNLRRRDRAVRDSIGHSGEHLATYFYSMSDDEKTAVIDTLVNQYPQLGHLQNVLVQDLPGGWKELMLHESFDSNSHQMTRSRHINDGLLRLIAILSELRSQHSFLLFDEIENGINAELVEALIDQLTTASPQVLITSHSPMILNYLDDETARQSVIFLYKGPDGGTRSKRFFEIPSMREKLEVMGPGEVFVDTNLTALSEELNSAVSGV